MLFYYNCIIDDFCINFKSLLWFLYNFDFETMYDKGEFLDQNEIFKVSSAAAQRGGR